MKKAIIALSMLAAVAIVLFDGYVYSLGVMPKWAAVLSLLLVCAAVLITDNAGAERR